MLLSAPAPGSTARRHRPAGVDLAAPSTGRATAGFDETDLLSNTNEIRFSLVNRLYVKRSDGAVSQVLSWDLSQARSYCLAEIRESANLH